MPAEIECSLVLSIGGSDNQNVPSLEIYFPKLNKWFALHELPHGIKNFYQGAAAVVGSSVIVVGGWNFDEALKDVYSLELKTLTWTKLNSMITPRNRFNVATLEGSLYAIAGSDGIKYLNTVERWNPSNNSWDFVAPLSMARSAFAAAALGDILYVIGGWDGHNSLSSIEAYNPHTNTWSSRASMHCHRQDPAVGIANGQLYVLGGFDGVATLNSVERYNPESDTWTMLTSFSISRSASGCVVLNNEIFLAGGVAANGSDLQAVEKYNVNTNVYTNIAPLLFPRSFATLLSVPNIIPKNLFNLNA